MSAHIEIDEKPGVWVLEASGELDYADCEPFRRNVERILSQLPRACIVDLSRIEYLDSSGLGLLLRLYREYTSSGGRLVLIASPVVDGILEITRLDELFTTAHDLDAALASVGPPEGGRAAG
jgi:anti-sigma B factor antagonist